MQEFLIFLLRLLDYGSRINAEVITVDLVVMKTSSPASFEIKMINNKIKKKK